MPRSRPTPMHPSPRTPASPSRGGGEGNFSRQGEKAATRFEMERPAPIYERLPPLLTDFPFFAVTVEGVEAIAEDEIRAIQRRAKIGPVAPGMVSFDVEVHPEDLLNLRCTEDVFATLALLKPLRTDEVGAQQVFRAAQRSPLWEDALELQRMAQPGKKPRPTFRVVAQLAGQHDFRRVDLKQAVVDAIVQRTRGTWKYVDEGGAIEVWIRGEEEFAALGIRLSDQTMRHRTYKVAQLPASLKPTVAAAMVRLTRPQPDEVFLDPMCGSGTILIERALAGRYQMILGGDADIHALEASQANVGRRYQPLRIQPMDVRRLPVETASVDKIATNMPFGRQVGDPVSLPTLYAAAFGEFARVVKPGGRAALLVSREGEWKTALKATAAWKLRQQHRIRLLGQISTLLILDRNE